MLYISQKPVLFNDKPVGMVDILVTHHSPFSPKILWLSCSDSLSPEPIKSLLKIGDDKIIYTQRNIGKWVFIPVLVKLRLTERYLVSFLLGRTIASLLYLRFFSRNILMEISLSSDIRTARLSSMHWRSPITQPSQHKLIILQKKMLDKHKFGATETSFMNGSSLSSILLSITQILVKKSFPRRTYKLKWTISQQQLKVGLTRIRSIWKTLASPFRDSLSTIYPNTMRRPK